MFLFRSANHSVKWNLARNSIHYSTRSTPTAESVTCPFSSTPERPVKVNDSKKNQFVDSPEEYQKARPFSEIPGPSALNFIWNTLIPGGKYYKEGLKGLHQKFYTEFGDICRFPGLGRNYSMVFVYDANLVEKVFRNEGQYPDRRGFEFFEEFRTKVRPDVFQGLSGLLQDQGPAWQDTRSKVNPVLMQPKTVSRYVETVETIAEDFVTRIRSIRDGQNEVPADFSNEMSKWALESIAYVALDQRLGLFTDTNPESDGQTLIKNVHDFFYLSFDMEVKPSLWRYYKTPSYHKMVNCLNSITNIIMRAIDKSIAEIESNQTASKNDEESVLRKLLKIDKRVAIIMALDMLMAGVDTTGNTSVTLLYYLAKNPEKQALLRKEIMEKLPRKDSCLTSDSMKNMPYLRACIKEAQRLEPVLVGTMRKLEADVVMKNYRVPKNTYIIMSQFIMSRKEEHFKRPNEYIPERFLKSEPNSELKMNQPFSFLPFGFGPRMCIGRRIAELEIEILISKLVRNFEIEWHYPDMQYGKDTFINAPTGDLKFRFKEVKE